MHTKQKTALLVICLMLVCALMAHADGAPTSQFYFSGWPYRQSSGCGGSSGCDASNGSSSCATASPDCSATDLPACTAPTCEPTAIPAEPTAQPTEAPTASKAPAVTAAPPVTAAPTATPNATKAPQATQTPQSTSTPSATQTPIATAAPTKAPTGNDGDYTTGTVSAQEQNAYRLLNEDRAANGLSALTLDSALCDLARMKSKDMCDNNYFAHTSPTYGSAADMLRTYGYSFTSVGENIAHHASVLKAQAAFMSSTGHRQNILGSQWKRVGVGVWTDAQGFVYVTQLFVR